MTRSNTKATKLTVKDGWLICPICRSTRLLRVYPHTSGRSIQLYCKRCRQEILVDINPGGEVHHHTQNGNQAENNTSPKK